LFREPVELLQRFQLRLNRWNHCNYLFLRIIHCQNRFALLLEMLEDNSPPAKRRAVVKIKLYAEKLFRLPVVYFHPQPQYVFGG
jgi:hypothetical protein